MPFIASGGTGILQRSLVVEILLSSLPPSSHGFLPCVSPSLKSLSPISNKDNHSLDLGPTLNPG